MSRHRNIRNMNYEDECDGYEDVYGRSVDDDNICVSPSTASQYLYNRDRQNSMSGYFRQRSLGSESVAEQEEPIDVDGDFAAASAVSSAIDAERLRSCIEAMQSVLGDEVDEEELKRAAVAENYHPDAAIDRVLNKDKQTVRSSSQSAQISSKSNSDKADVASDESDLDFNDLLSAPPLASKKISPYTPSDKTRFGVDDVLVTKNAVVSDDPVTFDDLLLNVPRSRMEEKGHDFSGERESEKHSDNAARVLSVLDNRLADDSFEDFNDLFQRTALISSTKRVTNTETTRIVINTPTKNDTIEDVMSQNKSGHGAVTLDAFLEEPSDFGDFLSSLTNNSVDKSLSNVPNVNIASSVPFSSSSSQQSSSSSFHQHLKSASSNLEDVINTLKGLYLAPTCDDVIVNKLRQQNPSGLARCLRVGRRRKPRTSRRMENIVPTSQFDFNKTFSPDDIVRMHRNRTLNLNVPAKPKSLSELLPQRLLATDNTDATVSSSHRQSFAPSSKANTSAPLTAAAVDAARIVPPPPKQPAHMTSSGEATPTMTSSREATPTRQPMAFPSATPTRKGVSSISDSTPTACKTPLTVSSALALNAPSPKASPKPSPKPSPKVQRSKKNIVDVKKLYEEEHTKPLLNLVVIGHVDAGKSTLMGHLLFLLGSVSQKQMHKFEQDSKKLGKASFAFAFVLDETEEERARGITMDVAQARFETPTKSVVLLDAPGHRDFIPNMITGAAQADVAILVVDATRGEFETGFEMGGQTREHTFLIRSLGVSQLAVAVNKLDNVDWSKERFDEISTALGQFLKQIGFRDSDVTYVPCSGLAGVNLVRKISGEPATLAAWYSGPCLVDVIDSFKPPSRPIEKPLRMCVSDVFKNQGSGISVSGKIECGSLCAGDKFMVMPAGETYLAKVVSIDDIPVSRAFAGDHCSVGVVNVDTSAIDIGAILCDPDAPIKAVDSFEARIVVFNVAVPIIRGTSVTLHYQSSMEAAVIHRIVAQLNRSTGEVIKEKPRCLGKNSSAVVKIRTSRPVCVELYKDCKELGRVTLRVGGATIAAGVVTKLYGVSEGS